MKSKVVLFIAASLDGYIARPDGTVDWLFDVDGGGGDGGYQQFYEGVGTIVMGRLTYDVILTLEDNFPYKGKPCYVLSRSPQRVAEHVIFTSEAVDSLIPRLQNESKGDVWLVGGGQLVQEFLKHELLDEIQLTVIPKVLGEGIPLFPQGTVPSNFQLHHVQRMGQMVTLTYQSVKE